MRKPVMFIAGLAAFVLIPHEVAAAVKLTSQQVENTCGSKFTTEASGVSGCYKDCGLNASTTASSLATKETATALVSLAGPKTALDFSPTYTPIVSSGAR
jgi:hypothetical protein